MAKTKKTIEIMASVSAVIPTGNYENYKPMYSVKEIIKCPEDSPDAGITLRTEQLRAILTQLLDSDYERLRIERCCSDRGRSGGFRVRCCPCRESGARFDTTRPSCPSCKPRGRSSRTCCWRRRGVPQLECRAFSSTI